MESNLIYLGDVVDQYLLQYRLPDSAHYRLTQLAIRGRKELHLHSCGKPVTVPLEVQADNTLCIPCDSLNILSLFVEVGGHKVILEENESLLSQYSYCKDRETSIRLSSAFAESEVMCEYLPQATQDGDYIVHPLFEEALINWIIWQDSRGDRKTGDGTKRENERIYFNSLRNARRAVKPFSLDQMYKSWQRTTTNNLSVFNAN
jgi:hypothetical protein